MKQCNKCNVDLVIGENWTLSKKKQSNYRCKPCYNKYHKKYRKTPNGKLALKKAVTKYDNSPTGRLVNRIANKKCSKKRNISEGVGVYQVMLGEICMYIGEGQIRSRKNHHLKGTVISTSAVYTYCLEHNINRELLSFNVLELQDDTTHRKELEDWYITFLNPVINPTPPKKLFGDV